MQWFKHDKQLRHSPAMQLIQRRLGNDGFAAAYRLLEVMAARCGSGENFTECLILASPTTREWLMQEICTFELDTQEDWEQALKDFDYLLKVFEEARFIELGTIQAAARRQNDEGKWVDVPNATFETIRVIRFEELADTWTARTLHAGRGQGKGGGGNGSNQFGSK